ncbi:phage tail protein [Burkholderia multivorans]|nr:phage tail protein [Burkholderia multivorans]
MAKVVGSYASVTRGVSEQVPQDRHPGQMWEQVNMISDPVVGCARRPGSILKDYKVLMTGTSLDALRADIRLYRTFTFTTRGKEYALLYRCDVASSSLPAFLCYCKTDAKFLNVTLADPSGMAPWVSGGVSAVCAVGDFIAIAANKLGPGYSIDDRYAAHNMHGVAWVRGGAYSRTYTLKVVRRSDGQTFVASYTTMASSYPNLLNTSDIPASAPDYQKQVNDRVNAYNSAVNQWIGDAQASIQPQNIAEKLRAALQSQGFTNCDRRGGTVILDNISFMSCDDGGDGTTFRAVFNTLDDVGKLSSIHWDGKVVQIKANSQVDPFYMVFKTDTGEGYGTGKWVEGPAQIVQPGQVFAVGGVTPDGGTFVIGSGPAQLNGYGGGGMFNCPTFAGSICGDKDQTGAIPYFFGKRISLMTMFQDRLVIVSDGTVFMSRSGDYFNFFRRTMLSVNDDDPIQAYALGAADDVITKAVMYNKNLFMFGLRNQYTIPGNVAATPSNVTISAVASERDAVVCQPVVHGNIVFYASQVASNGDVPFSGMIHQFQLGLFQDIPETFQISKQLSRYIKGRPTEMATISAPPALLVRTDGNDNGFYAYTYLDAPGTQQREFDSWSRWQFSDALGVVAGVTSFQQKLLSFSIALDAKPGKAANVIVMCNEFSMDTSDRTRPYLDAMRPMDQDGPMKSQLNTAGMWDDAYAAIGATHDEFLLHTKLTDWTAFRTQYASIPDADHWGGFDYPSFVVPTPPYVRDSNDKAIVNGRLVVNKYTVSFTNSSGCDVDLIDKTGKERHIVSYAGRQVGHSNNLVGRVPISTTNFPVPVGRANIEHKIKFIAKPCLPMTISAIEWVGQFFTSGRRV